MAELRKDPTRGQWVLIRPKGTWAPDAPCRYCPGAEHLTGAEISAYRKDGSLANGPGWTVRVVPEADAYFRALRAELETALTEGVILLERQEVWIP